MKCIDFEFVSLMGLYMPTNHYYKNDKTLKHILWENANFLIVNVGEPQC